MILICPHCDTKFEINAAALGEDGRKVKCSSCAEVWFQEAPKPDNDESAADDVTNIVEDALEEIPEEEKIDEAEADALDETIEELQDDEDTDKDISENEDTESIAEDNETISEKATDDFDVNAAHPKAPIFGSAAAAVIFFFFFALLLLFKTPLMNTFPSMIALYKPLGLVHIQGADELVFDKIALTPAKDGKMMLTGNIVNLGQKAVMLPHIKATITDKNDNVLEYIYIDPEKDVVDSEKLIIISHMFDELKPEASSVTLNFVITKKKDEKSKSTDENDHGEKMSKDDHPEKVNENNHH